MKIFQLLVWMIMSVIEVISCTLMWFIAFILFFPILIICFIGELIRRIKR